MSRLVVQHPTLTDQTVQGFAGVIGAQPDARKPDAAFWHSISINSEHVSRLAAQFQVDAEIVPATDRLEDYRLIAFDMDSTLITVECIDEIADFAGCKAEVGAITEATMRGEIRDFAESLKRRVALLAGLPETVLESVYRERVRLSPGVANLLSQAQASGLKTLLVSGGFTYFTSRLAEKLSFDWQRANELEIIDGRLTGRVTGPIVDGELKRSTVLQVCSHLQCEPRQSIVIGDGSNDLPMMSIAGVSVAYHAKPVVRSETTHQINHCGLDAVLNFFSTPEPARA